MRALRFSLLFAGMAIAALATPRAVAQTKDGPALAVRKALDQKITLDFSSQSIQEAIDHLQQKTKLNIVLDNYVVQIQGIGINGVPSPVTLKSDGGKVRTALQNMLNQYNLSFIILGDTVLITTDEIGYLRQLRQRVNIDVSELPLASILKQLSDETGVNLLIDPRQADKAKGKITLQVDDVTLETAVRLLTELADLSSVRVGNVLLITTEARADKLRKENAGPNVQPHGPIYTTPGFPGGLPPINGGGFGGRAAPGFGGGAPPFPGVAPPPPAINPPNIRETPATSPKQ